MSLVALEIDFHHRLLLIVVVTRSRKLNRESPAVGRQVDGRSTQSATVRRVAHLHHTHLGIEVFAAPARSLEILAVYGLEGIGSTQIGRTCNRTLGKIFRQQNLSPSRWLTAVDMERITDSPLDRRPVGRKAGSGYAGSLVGHGSIDGRATHKIEGNHPVCLGNVGYRLTQQQPCIGHCRRCALVGKRVVILVGIEVSRLVVEAAMVIGRHDGHALAGRLAIHDIVVPDHPVVIDLQNHQTRRGHVGIPPRLLAVLEGEVLILVARYNLVGLFAVGQIFERNGSRRGQLFDGEPAAKFAFIRGVAYGDRTVAMAVAVHVGTVVATIIHQAPGTHSIVGTAGIVEVGQTQRVTVLVAERTDTITIGPGITLQLGRTGVCVEQFAIDRNLFPGTLVDIPGVGPDGVVERTGVIVGRLAITGIDDINQVDKAVVVAVVDGEIDHRLYLATSVDNHIFGAAVVTRILVVSSIVGHRPVESNGAHHVEGGTELSV